MNTARHAQGASMAFAIGRSRGFTLIELMIAIGVIGVLTNIAYPALGSHVMKARRADALVATMQVQMAEERWRATSAGYGTLAEIGASATSPLRAYAVEVGNLTADGYRITATAVGSQSGDAACRVMQMVVSGDRVDTSSGTDPAAANDIAANRACWGQR